MYTLASPADDLHSTTPLPACILEGYCIILSYQAPGTSAQITVANQPLPANHFISRIKSTSPLPSSPLLFIALTLSLCLPLCPFPWGGGGIRADIGLHLETSKKGISTNANSSRILAPPRNNPKCTPHFLKLLTPASPPDVISHQRSLLASPAHLPH